MMMNTRTIRKFKQREQGRPLQMLTCYDFQTARLLNESALDLILVGDSLGNVILGYEDTVQVSMEEMAIFGAAVRRGAPDKFLTVDLPFGSYAHFEQSLDNSRALFQKTGANALKLEGAYPYQLEIVRRLAQIGIPIMGHIGLTPQSVHQQGGYYVHGKTPEEASFLLQSAKDLEAAGVFSLVLECVTAEVAAQITKELTIPTIGIGSGKEVDGQVLVINDLLRLGPTKPPQFVSPIANLYETKKDLLKAYLDPTKK